MRGGCRACRFAAVSPVPRDRGAPRGTRGLAIAPRARQLFRRPLVESEQPAQRVRVGGHGFLVGRGLTVNPGVAVRRAPPTGPRLVLEERDQRELHAWFARLPGDMPAWLSSLRESVDVLVEATLVAMLWEGRRDEVRAVLVEVVGEARGVALAERFETRAQEQGWVP